MHVITAFTQEPALIFHPQRVPLPLDAGSLGTRSPDHVASETVLRATQIKPFLLRRAILQSFRKLTS